MTAALPHEERSPGGCVIDDPLLHQLLRERAAQGLPPTIEDPIILAKIAAIMMGDGERYLRAVPDDAGAGQSGET